MEAVRVAFTDLYQFLAKLRVAVITVLLTIIIKVIN